MSWANANAHKIHSISSFGCAVWCYVLCCVCSLLLLLRLFYALQESASIYCDGIFNIHRARQYVCCVCAWSFTLILKFKALSRSPDWWRRANPSTITCFFVRLCFFFLLWQMRFYYPTSLSIKFIHIDRSVYKFRHWRIISVVVGVSFFSP